MKAVVAVVLYTRSVIEYYFDDEPINSSFCYCRDCQKITGSDKFFGL